MSVQRSSQVSTPRTEAAELSPAPTTTTATTKSEGEGGVHETKGLCTYTEPKAVKELPQEVLNHCLSWSTPEDLASLSRAGNSDLYESARDNDLWADLLRRDFPNRGRPPHTSKHRRKEVYEILFTGKWKERSFSDRPTWQRVLILIGCVIFSIPLTLYLSPRIARAIHSSCVVPALEAWNDAADAIDPKKKSKKQNYDEYDFDVHSWLKSKGKKRRLKFSERPLYQKILIIIASVPTSPIWLIKYRRAAWVGIKKVLKFLGGKIQQLCQFLKQKLLQCGQWVDRTVITPTSQWVNNNMIQPTKRAVVYSWNQLVKGYTVTSNFCKRKWNDLTSFVSFHWKRLCTFVTTQWNHFSNWTATQWTRFSSWVAAQWLRFSAWIGSKRSAFNRYVQQRRTEAYLWRRRNWVAFVNWWNTPGFVGLVVVPWLDTQQKRATKFVLATYQAGKTWTVTTARAISAWTDRNAISPCRRAFWGGVTWVNQKWTATKDRSYQLACSVAKKLREGGQFVSMQWNRFVVNPINRALNWCDRMVRLGIAKLQQFLSFCSRKIWNGVNYVADRIWKSAVWTYDKILVPSYQFIVNCAKKAYRGVVTMKNAFVNHVVLPVLAFCRKVFITYPVYVLGLGYYFVKDRVIPATVHFVRSYVVNPARAAIGAVNRGTLIIMNVFWTRVCLPIGRAIRDTAIAIKVTVKNTIAVTVRITKLVCTTFYEHVLTPLGRALKKSFLAVKQAATFTVLAVVGGCVLIYTTVAGACIAAFLATKRAATIVATAFYTQILTPVGRASLAAYHAVKSTLQQLWSAVKSAAVSTGRMISASAIAMRQFIEVNIVRPTTAVLKVVALSTKTGFLALKSAVLEAFFAAKNSLTSLLRTLKSSVQEMSRILAEQLKLMMVTIRDALLEVFYAAQGLWFRLQEKISTSLGGK